MMYKTDVIRPYHYMKCSRYTTTQFLNKMWTKISFASINKTIFAVVLKNISCFRKANDCTIRAQNPAHATHLHITTKTFLISPADRAKDKNSRMLSSSQTISGGQSMPEGNQKAPAVQPVHQVVRSILQQGGIDPQTPPLFGALPVPGLCPGAAGRRRVQAIFFLLYTTLVILPMPHLSFSTLTATCTFRYSSRRSCCADSWKSGLPSARKCTRRMPSQRRCSRIPVSPW